LLSVSTTFTMNAVYVIMIHLVKSGFAPVFYIHWVMYVCMCQYETERTEKDIALHVVE